MTKKHNALRALLPWAGLLLALSLIAAAFLLDARISDSVGGLLFGLAGALAGVSGTAIILETVYRKATPEERKELDRAEKDERNVSIREKAAYSSWYWTLALLCLVFLLALVLGDTADRCLAATLVVGHNAFYLVNVNRWSKKM